MSRYITTFSIPNHEQFQDLMENAFKFEHKYSYTQMPFFQNGPESYPMWLFPTPLTFEFSPVIIFYGGNGSGKSTILNLIAEKMKMGRRAAINTSTFFKVFAEHCGISIHSDFDDINHRCDIISSDDVFRHCFELREKNKELSGRQFSLIQQQRDFRNGKKVKNLHGLDDFERYRKECNLRKNSFSKCLDQYVGHTFKPSSNGETALEFFTSAIDSAGLYLLDEPENSMSPAFQLKLLDFLQTSAMYLGMQFIIATHSPLILGMEGATIYNLDLEGAPQCKWSELENIQILHSFFKERENEFEE